MSLYQNGGGQILADGVRCSTDLACGDLRILRGDCAVDIASRKVEANKLVGIDPDAHGAL